MANEKDPKTESAHQETLPQGKSAQEAPPQTKPMREEAPPRAKSPKQEALLQAKVALDEGRVRLAKAEADLHEVLQKSQAVAPLKSGTVLGGAAPKVAPAVAQRALSDARDMVRVAAEEFHRARVRDIPATHEEEFRRLDTGVPLVMLPVRIETRFSPNRASLLVRVYPDEIFADGHETGLTAAERTAGSGYWQAVHEGKPEIQAWQSLIQQFPVPRAAWIARITEPEGGDAAVPIPSRPRSWSRAIEANALPDRWIVVHYVGDVRQPVFVGPPIQIPLALSLNPQRASGTPEGTLPVDRDAAWLTDFDAACRAGMAFSFPTNPTMLRQGVARLLVVGVRSTLSPEASATELERLFDAHHYHSGLAFVRQGTPTTNTRTYHTGFPSKDPGGRDSFHVEREGRRARAGDDPRREDGRRFAAALGVRENLFDRVEGTQREECEAAKAMMTVLWPATLGYWLDVLMSPLVPTTSQAELREYTTRNVQGRGPLPAFRVGRVPYGVLPVTTFDGWKAIPGDPPIEGTLVTLLQDLRPFWRDAMVSAPALSRSSGDPGPDGPDPNGGVFRVLTLLASSVEIRRRIALGGQVSQQTLEALGVQQVSYWRDHLARTLDPLRSLRGLVGEPRLASFLQANVPDLIDLPLVGGGGAEEELVTYLALLRSARVGALQRDDVLQPEDERPWLYRIVRHSMLLQLRRVARELAYSVDPSRTLGLSEPEVVNVRGFAAPSVDIFLDPTLTHADATPFQNRIVADLREGHPELGDFDTRLGELARLPRVELERLLSETLDVCSHRIDAWSTGVAARRIEVMRRARPRGLTLGAWGWVEGILLDEGLREVREVPGVYRQSRSGGFIHAPSIDHAAAGALLRNAWLQRYGTERDQVAIDLSPQRVRHALWLMEGVRQGLPLGALLGQEFERGLRSRGLQYMRFIDTLRLRFPLTEPITPETDASAPGARDRIVPRDVVNGLALHRERDRVRVELERVEPIDAWWPTIEAELDRLAEAVDAVSDLLTAESTFQTVKGQPGVAGASLTALSRGERPPDPEVARTPRSGRSVTHRVILRFEQAPPGVQPAWGALMTTTPRASASRTLEAWLEHTLGPPENIGCPVAYETSVGDQWEAQAPYWLTVAKLGLRAVDLFALLREDDVEHPASELQLRIAAAMQGVAPGSRGHRADFHARGGRSASTRTLGEAIALLRLARGVLTRARPLRAEDLSAPHAPVAAYARADSPDVDAQRLALDDLGRDLDAALLAWGEATESPTAALATLEGALRRASLFGIDRAYPAHVEGDDGARFKAMRAQAVGVRAEVQRRSAAAARAATNNDPGARAKAIFGEDFVFLPAVPGGGPELDAAFRTSGLLEDPNDPWKWLQQSARVRPAVGSLSRMLAALLAIDGSWSIDVAQLPHVEGTRWAGWRVGAGDLPHNMTSLAMIGPPAEAPPPYGWAALLVDEWPERVPASEETTGVSFHFNDPGVEAAQAILLVAPPAPDTPWSLDVLERILWQTLELARIRAVTPDLLGRLGQYLPALFLAENTRNETVSTSLSGDTREEPSIAREP